VTARVIAGPEVPERGLMRSLTAPLRADQGSLRCRRLRTRDSGHPCEQLRALAFDVDEVPGNFAK
jgi:hypothetical protein